MIEINVAPSEFYDEAKEEFITPIATKLKLEHSLISLSKWESKWLKPFVGREDLTEEETLDYIKCMTLNDEVIDPLVYLQISSEEVERINAYIDHKMTATWFNDGPGRPSREVVTSELIYYWMISLQIPFLPCETWHLHRLLTLIKVCNLKNTPSKKMKKKEIATRNQQINAARKKALGTTG